MANWKNRIIGVVQERYLKGGDSTFDSEPTAYSNPQYQALAKRLEKWAARRVSFSYGDLRREFLPHFPDVRDREYYTTLALESLRVTGRVIRREGAMTRFTWGGGDQ